MRCSLALAVASLALACVGCVDELPPPLEAAGGAGTSASSGVAGGTSGSGGVQQGGSGGGGGSAGATAQHVYYFGDFEVNGVEQAALTTFPAGTSVTLSLGAISGAIDAMATTADGANLVVAGPSSEGLATIQVYPRDGGTGEIVYTASDAWVDIGPLRVSPDGNQIAFIADVEMDGVRSAHVVPIRGGGARRVSPAPSANREATQIYWSGDSVTLAIRGDLEADDVFGLWVVDTTEAIPQPVPVLSALELGQGDVTTQVAWDVQGRVYFASDHEVDELYALYRCEANGSDLEVVPGTTIENGPAGPGRIHAFGFDPSGTFLAFAVEAPEPGVAQIWTVSTADDSDAPVPITSVSSIKPPGDNAAPGVGTPIVWSPDGKWLATIADWILDAAKDVADSRSLFLFPSDGSDPIGARVLGYPGSKQNLARTFAFSTDSQRVFVLGNFFDDIDTTLLSTSAFDVADQDPNGAVVRDVPNNCAIRGFAIAPGGP